MSYLIEVGLAASLGAIATLVAYVINLRHRVAELEDDAKVATKRLDEHYESYWEQYHKLDALARALDYSHVKMHAYSAWVKKDTAEKTEA